MRRYIALLLLVFLMTGIMNGCGNSGTDGTTDKDTTDTANVAEQNGEKDTTAKEDATEEEKKEVVIQTPSQFSQTGAPEEGETIAIIRVKDMGEIRVKFFYEDSPLAVENFVNLAANGYYNGVTFHRVIQDFMIQGGDPTGTGTGGESMWGENFKNEYSDRLAHINGSLAMARSEALDTNSSQFFINNNDGITWTEAYLQAYGVPEQWWSTYTNGGGNPHLQDLYTVLGQVYEGMDVVDAISAVEVNAEDEYKPVNDVIIESIEITTYTSSEPADATIDTTNETTVDTTNETTTDTTMAETNEATTAE